MSLVVIVVVVDGEKVKQGDLFELEDTKKDGSARTVEDLVELAGRRVEEEIGDDLQLFWVVEIGTRVA